MNPSTIKTYTFHVSGMHCSACEHLIESELGELAEISSVNANLKRQIVSVSGTFGDRSEQEIAGWLSVPVYSHGYALTVEKKAQTRAWSDFKVAGPTALAFLLFFVLLQKAGIVNLIGTGTVTYGTAFVIGVVASLSTCMAVVGGLVLSMSATFAKERSAFKPQALFHIGRLVAFFLLGGVIGAIGTAFTLTTTATFILGLVVGLVMLILGLNLLDVFKSTGAFQLSLPKSLSRYALNVSKFNHSLTPFLIGVVTFFLPCGFTQSMQLYTLTTGGFVAGGITMLAFALGTFPVLALISFSSFSIQKSQYASTFFKTAGLIVIAFALMNIINSFVIVGVLPPIFNF